jgi:hypothetical protein
MRGVLAFGVVGNRVYAIDVGEDLSLQRVEFKSSFSVGEVGELRAIKFLTPSKLFITGTEGSAIYSLGWELTKKTSLQGWQGNSPHKRKANFGRRSQGS